MKQEENNYNLMLTSLLIYFIECINCMNIQSKFEKDKPLILDTDEISATESQYFFSIYYCTRKL